MADILSAKELRESRAPLVTQIKELNDLAQAEEREFSADEQEKWDSINTEYDSLTARLTKSERTEKLVAEAEERREAEVDVEAKDSRDNAQRVGRENRSFSPVAPETPEDKKPTEAQRCLALQGWMRTQYDYDLNADHSRAMEICGIRPRGGNLDLPLRRDDYSQVRAMYHRAQSAFNLAGGGATVPEGFINNLEVALLQFGGVRQVADVMRTTSGNNLPWPTVNDTTNSGTLVGENTTVTETAVTYSQVIFYANKWTSNFVLVPHELLEDSAFDMAASLGRLMGERLGRIQNTNFTTGTGVGQPKGIVTAATTVAAAAATAISLDDILNLVHSVDPAYRQQSPGFMMHDNIVRDVRKLKDGNGQYLWQPSNAAGVADRLMGYAITVNQDMQSSLAASTDTVIFGALAKYKIRDVGSIRMRRLQERYADLDQEGFVAFARGDGNLLDAGTNPVYKLTQAA